RVSIDCVLCPDSPLPIPVRGVLTTILDAHNSFVAWPEKWVIVGDKDVVDDSFAANGEVASQLQKFGKIIEKMMKSSQISIPLENGVFEKEIAFNYFLKSDLLDICNMKKLEVNSMTAYLRGHWLLLIIDMTSMEVFWLDSMVRKVIDLDVKFIVNDAMKVAAMEMGKRTKGNPTWELVKCPKQTGNKECGVYGMKFMKHLMEDPLMSTKYKLKELGEQNDI
ncbi:hypothetical protein IFM89_002544, partial [Coptis chinensis]